MGADSLLWGSVGGDTVSVRIGPDDTYEPGERIEAWFQPRPCLPVRRQERRSPLASGIVRSSRLTKDQANDQLPDFLPALQRAQLPAARGPARGARRDRLRCGRALSRRFRRRCGRLPRARSTPSDSPARPRTCRSTCSNPTVPPSSASPRPSASRPRSCPTWPRTSGRRMLPHGQAFAGRLSEHAAALAEDGLKLGWHTHAFEYETLPDGTRPIDALMAARRALLRAGHRLDRALRLRHPCRAREVPRQDLRLPRQGYRPATASPSTTAGPMSAAGTIDWKGLWPVDRRLGLRPPGARERQPLRLARLRRPLLQRSSPASPATRRPDLMARDARIGIIGCGNISDTYFSFAPLFKGLRDRRLRRHQGAAGRGQGREVRGPAP